MKKLDLRMLAQWIDPVFVEMLETRRRRNHEWHRRRKLATLETLWLMLAVSLDTQRASLYEILRLATAQLGVQWSISVAAFKGLGPVSLELCCLFDVISRAPLRFVYGKVCTSEHKLIRTLIQQLKKGDLLLLDSGFYYCATFIKILARLPTLSFPPKPPRGHGLCANSPTVTTSGIDPAAASSKLQLLGWNGVSLDYQSFQLALAWMELANKKGDLE